MPLFKKGGLGDVSYALPVALSKLGVTVAIVMPFYAGVKVKDPACIGQLAVDFDKKRELVFVFSATIPNTKVPIYLIRHPRLDDYMGRDIAETFAFFCQAVARLYLFSPHILGGAFDIIHCHDWHTALIPMLLGENNKTKPRQPQTLEAADTKTIITIHNLLYQGETGVRIIRKIGLPRTLFHVFKTPLGHAVKLLREGLDYADVISTVSPTYAKEIVSPAKKGRFINDVLRRRKDRVVGIINGIDPTIWDPKIDPTLPVNYDKETVFDAKIKIKHHLRTALHVPQVDVPLFGFVGRIEPRQKGMDILREAVTLLPKGRYQIAILGTGPDIWVRMLTNMAKRSHNIAFVHTFDERLARRIYAGSDFMLVPSKFEPCGLTQLIAMRYGTIPLVRKTGGLADTVRNGRTGFVFDRYEARSLAKSMKYAIDFWNTEPLKFREYILRVMKQDFSWDQSARKYRSLYRRLLKSKTGKLI